MYNLVTKKSNPIVSHKSIWIEEYDYLISIVTSKNSPIMCGFWEGNYGMIKFFDNKSGHEKILFNEPNTEYSLIEFDEDDQSLKFKSRSMSSFEDKNKCVNNIEYGDKANRSIKIEY